jgi:hypothetical protein
MAFRPNASWAGPAPDMRRPNASWVGPPPEGIASPGHLNLPRGGVGMPHGLPPQLGFGALNPSLTTGSHFTGASIPGAQSMVHPEMPQTFQAPVYSGPSMGSAPAPKAIAPIIAALMATGVGAPTASAGVRPAPPPPSSVGHALSPSGPGYPTPTQITQGAANAATYPTGDLGIASSFISNPYQSQSLVQRKTSPAGSNYYKSQ